MSASLGTAAPTFPDRRRPTFPDRRRWYRPLRHAIDAVAVRYRLLRNVTVLP